MEKLANVAGRVLLAGIFIWSGLGTAPHLAGLAAYLGSLHLPWPQLLAPAVIAWELVGGMALLLGFYTRWSALLLAAFCVATAFMVHYHPADMEAMINFAKNLALTGGFLFVAIHGGGAWSLDERLKLKGR